MKQGCMELAKAWEAPLFILTRDPEDPPVHADIDQYRWDLGARPRRANALTRLMKKRIERPAPGVVSELSSNLLLGLAILWSVWFLIRVIVT